MQVHDLFGDIPAFVYGGQIPEVTARKLQDILNDQQKLALLKVELAITVDAMKPFVQSVRFFLILVSLFYVEVS